MKRFLLFTFALASAFSCFSQATVPNYIGITPGLEIPMGATASTVYLRPDFSAQLSLSVYYPETVLGIMSVFSTTRFEMDKKGVYADNDLSPFGASTTINGGFKVRRLMAGPASFSRSIGSTFIQFGWLFGAEWIHVPSISYASESNLFPYTGPSRLASAKSTAFVTGPMLRLAAPLGEKSPFAVLASFSMFTSLHKDVKRTFDPETRDRELAIWQDYGITTFNAAIGVGYNLY